MSSRVSCSIAIRLALFTYAAGSGMAICLSCGSFSNWSCRLSASSARSVWLYQVTLSRISSWISLAPKHLGPWGCEVGDARSSPFPSVGRLREFVWKR
jgi:hypothetical protein